MTARVNWVDSAKGAMIFLVVVGHAWRGLAPSGIIPSDLYTAVDTRIYAFHMPVFFALAGWFFVASITKASVPTFLRSRLLRLLWPMVLWTYLFLAIKALAGQYANTPISLQDVLIVPIPGVLHMWFLWALLLLNLAFLCLKPVSKDGKTPTGVLWATVAIVALLQFVDIGPQAARWIGPAIVNAPFFLLGVVLGQKNWLRATPPHICVLASAVFVALLIFWPLVAPKGYSLLGSLVLSACILVAFSGLSAGISKPLAFLGGASMAIYLSHTIFSASLREALFVIGIDSLAIHMILATLIGLIGPLILLTLARRTGTIRLLGF